MLLRTSDKFSGSQLHACTRNHCLYERYIVLFPLNVLLRLARGDGSGSLFPRIVCCGCSVPSATVCCPACCAVLLAFRRLPLPLPRIAVYCCLLLPRAVNCYCCYTRDTCFNWTFAPAQKLYSVKYISLKSTKKIK